MSLQQTQFDNYDMEEIRKLFKPEDLEPMKLSSVDSVELTPEQAKLYNNQRILRIINK